MHFKLLGSVGTFLKSEFSCVLCFLGLHFYYWYMTSNTSTRFTLKIKYVFMTVLLVQLITNIEMLLSLVDNSATYFSRFLQKHIKCYSSLHMQCTKRQL